MDTPLPTTNTEITISQQSPSPEQTDTRWIKPLIIALSVIIGLVILIFLFFFLTNKNLSTTSSPPSTRSATTIAGQVNFQGYAPSDAYIAIAERAEGHGQFKDVVSGLAPQDGSISWVWNDATAGNNYEIKALLKVKGKTIQESPVLDISAPATNVLLTLVSQQSPSAPVTATVNGQINLDGYVPSGATMQVLAKEVGSTTYQTVVSSLVAQDNAVWSWTNAMSAKTYMLKGQLVTSGGSVISTGDIQTVTAPSTGILLNVASTATPPTPVVTGISGNITVNGSIPSGSYITLGVRKTGESAFSQVASNISATNGVGFSWGSAQSGQQYDVQAYLWVNGKPYAQSNVLTVTAPSTFDVLTINAQQALQSPPSSTITVSCGGQQNGVFQATINFNTQGNLSNPKSYNIIVTLASQNSQVINTTISPSNPTSAQSITTTYVFQSGATYYAQYAYSPDGSTFSPLSSSIQFACR